MNSLRRASPGWVRMRAIACPSVIIDALDPLDALAPQSQSATAHRARSASATRAGLARAPRTANPASDDQDRSARLSPSPRKRGNRSCDRSMAGAHRRCSPVPRGECRHRLRAVGAPIRHRRSAPSGGGASVSDRASCQPGCPRNSSRPSSRRTGPAPHRRATRRRENRVWSSSPSAQHRPLLPKAPLRPRA